MKRLRWLVLVAVLAGLLLATIPVPALGMTGTGVPGDPYVIYNATDLQDMNLDLTAHYVLNNSIDASATVGWNGGAGFNPVGDSGAPNCFSGDFDGGNHTISDLWIDRPAEDYVGLFGETCSSANITNVVLYRATVEGDDQVGTLVGQSTGSTYIANVTITDSNVNGAAFCMDVGGLVGKCASSTQIEYSSYSGNVTPDSGSYIGGLCGTLTGSAIIYRCWSDTVIEALANFNRCWDVGGLVGYMLGLGGGATPVIRECFSYGDLTAYEWGANKPYNLGGLIGLMYDVGGSIVRVYDCGSLVDVSGVNGAAVGGFCGAIQFGNCDIYMAYSAGAVSGASGVGGFLGSDGGGASSTMTACFWDIQTSGQATSGGGEEVGRNTTDMKTETNYTAVGWNFTDIWGIDSRLHSGYPYLLAIASFDVYYWAGDDDEEEEGSGGAPHDREDLEDDDAAHQILKYEPGSVITSSTLPNELNPGTHDAEIRWGVNPAGVSANLSSFAVEETPTVYIPDDEYHDVVPGEVEVTDWFLEPAISTTLSAHPLRPLVTIMSNGTTITEVLAWRFLGLALVLLMTTLAAVLLRGHLLLAGLVCGGTIAVLVQQTVWPGWTLAFIIPAVIAGIMAERTPSIG